MDENKDLLENLIKLIEGHGAHAPLEKALEGIPEKDRGTKPDHLPYSLWQLAEHIRIAQWDMLEFCKSADHQSPKWPDEYWPIDEKPNDEEWNDMIQQLENDRQEFIELLQEKNLFEKIPHGEGQTLLQEALQLADHNAYHTAEIIVIRRLLKNWE